MWFLECDGDLFQNKRIWLRPGTEFLLGRTRPKAGSPGHFIEHSSVSRQHLHIAVDNVRSGDSLHLHIKSKLTITDGSKIGTVVDYDKISKQQRVLDQNNHTLRLGNYPNLFHIRWVATTFSFTSLSKIVRRSADPLYQYREILEPLDIKCIPEYVTTFTSHAVTHKRNTPAVLQALVNGHQAVTDAYLAAVKEAGKKDSPEEQSLLEIDFDANWPKELDFLPPPGKEPNPRPERSQQFLPNPARSEMFTGYIFIFHEGTQHKSLMPVINGGGGKALLRQIQPDENDVTAMVDYIREAAGKKGHVSFNLSQQSRKSSIGGIIVVKTNASMDKLDDYYNKLDAELGQMSIEQNELLDAILDVDASKLKRKVRAVQSREDENMEDASTGIRTHEKLHHVEPTIEQRDPFQDAVQNAPIPDRVQQSPQIEDAVLEQQSATPRPSQPALRRRTQRARTTQPRFLGFDDFQPEMSMPRYQPPSPSQTPPSAQQADGSQRASADPADADDRDDEHLSDMTSRKTAAQPSQPHSLRKRPGDPLEEERETTSDVLNGILKGAAAMKRRKLENQRNKGIAQADDEEEEAENAVPERAAIKNTRQKKKDLDVMALVGERRQVEEEARLRDEEALREQLEGMDVSEVRNLAVIEEMDIVRREPPPRSRYHGNGSNATPPPDRWDDKWNGRKNFKKFRRSVRTAGDGAAEQPYVRHGRHRVIVPLEEVQKKAYGVGEDYWLEPVEETRRKQKERKRGTQSQRTSLDAVSSAAIHSGPTSQPQQSLQSQTRSGAENVDDEIASGDDNENDASRFRRRIRNSRIEDAATAQTDEVFPEEIAGTARDPAITAAAREPGGIFPDSHASVSAMTHAPSSRGSAQTQTQTQTSRDTADGRRVVVPRGKRPAAGELGGSAATKRPRQGRIAAASAAAQEDDSDEEDALRFRRRKR